MLKGLLLWGGRPLWAKGRQREATLANVAWPRKTVLEWMESIAFRDELNQQMILSARLVSITIFALFSLSLPTMAQSFNRQDLDCAVAATGESARAGTTIQNTELTHFFINRLVAQDDQTNWARVAYDRDKMSRKGASAELLAKCKELYLQSLHR